MGGTSPYHGLVGQTLAKATFELKNQDSNLGLTGSVLELLPQQNVIHQLLKGFSSQTPGLTTPAPGMFSILSDHPIIIPPLNQPSWASLFTLRTGEKNKVAGESVRA